MLKPKREPGPVAAGWRLLWQAQRMLWWIYAVNLALGFLATTATSMRMSSVLDHSLAAQRLYHGFDLAYFLELAANPAVQLSAQPTTSLIFAVLFFVFMLFATGGVLETYARTRMLVPGEFFQAAGAFLWRFVRLLLWLVVVLVPVALVASGLGRAADLFAGSERWYFGATVIRFAIVALLLMIVRLWFNMAQVRAVVEDERGMAVTLSRAFRLTFCYFQQLFWIYLRLSLLGWAGTVAALYVWIKWVPAERIGWAFLLAQFIAVWWIATRLWQRASEVIWYQRRGSRARADFAHAGVEQPRPEPQQVSGSFASPPAVETSEDASS